MKISTYDYTAVEKNIQDFWLKHQIYQKAKLKNKNGTIFYFLDGPPYTSGKVHLGTAWNKSLKDTFLRYKRMRGFNVWDRAGYDMHGLPTEHAVEKKLGLHGKEDILTMGVEPFVKECENLSTQNMHLMNEDFVRLGVWMDFENAYQSIKPEFIEGVWWLVKKVHEQGRLYEGLRTMHWCSSCATALAKHELEYKSVSDTSIFVKLELKDRKDEFLIIWTTTPWTIPFNLAVMVNPELEYVKCRVDEEYWYIAKALAGVLVQAVAGKRLEIVEEMHGEQMEGLMYVHPLASEIPEFVAIKKQSPRVHTVVLSSEYVDTSAGSGLVHCAPGCGPEDYEVGHRNQISPFNNIDERGIFPESMGKFSGLIARSDDAHFIDELKKRGAIIETSVVDHEYAHCQRCHNPVIFRTTVQWFFKIEDLKPRMIEFNNKIVWIPQAGFNAFDSWLRNLRDNSITKQRFWGTPLPVWKCVHCGAYDVVGSIAELQALSHMRVSDLHKPWIDEVTIPCKCGGSKTRIPDVMDVWLDAGTNSWTCLDFPQRTDLFESMFPAEFICEGKDQIRGWFYLMMLCGVLGFGKPSFKSVYMHGWVIDALGRKMSKSLGNYIVPEEVVASFGADAFRYYFIGAAAPGLDAVYNQDDVKSKFRNLGVLWNLHKFLIDVVNNKYTASDLEAVPLIPKLLGAEERYILSKAHAAVMHQTELYDAYNLSETPHVVEVLFLELSRTYIQLVREKLSVGSDDEKKIVAAVLYHVFLIVLKLCAPIMPFVSEMMYQHLREVFGWSVESVHLQDWPVCNKSFLDSHVEESMDVCSQVIASVLAAREKAGLGVRWPVLSVSVVTQDDEVTAAVQMLKDLIKTQTNIKEIKVVSSLKGVSFSAHLDTGKVGEDFGALSPRVMIAFGNEKPAVVISNIHDKNKHVLKVETQEVTLTQKHVVIDRAVPNHLIEIESKKCIIYLDKTRTPELDAEGYVRELMRRVQAFRKTQWLDKCDRVLIHIKVAASFLNQISSFEDVISEKVGAQEIVISSADPEQSYAWSTSEKIKDQVFGVWMQKV